MRDKYKITFPRNNDYEHLNKQFRLLKQKVGSFDNSPCLIFCLLLHLINTLLLQILLPMENLPREIAEAIKSGMEDSQLIQMANSLLEKGDQENAARVLEFCF